MPFVKMRRPDGSVTPVLESERDDLLAQGWVDAENVVIETSAGSRRAVTPGEFRTRANIGDVAGTVTKEQIANEAAYKAEKSRHEEQFSGAGHWLSSLAQGVGDIITLDGTKYLREGLGVEEYAADSREAHPYANVAGKIGGLAATLFLPTGAAGAAGTTAKGAKAGAEVAEVAAAAARVASPVSRIGGAILRNTPMGLVTRAGTATRAAAEGLGTVGSLAAGGAAEGAVMNAMHTVAGQVLGDEEFSAEAIASSIASGAVFGGVVGAGAGLAGKAASALTVRAEARAAKLAESNMTKEVTAERQAAKDALYKIRESRGAAIQTLKHRLKALDELSLPAGEKAAVEKQIKGLMRANKSLGKMYKKTGRGVSLEDWTDYEVVEAQQLWAKVDQELPAIARKYNIQDVAQRIEAQSAEYKPAFEKVFADNLEAIRISAARPVGEAVNVNMNRAEELSLKRSADFVAGQAINGSEHAAAVASGIARKAFGPVMAGVYGGPLGAAVGVAMSLGKVQGAMTAIRTKLDLGLRKLLSGTSASYRSHVPATKILRDFDWMPSNRSGKTKTIQKDYRAVYDTLAKSQSSDHSQSLAMLKARSPELMLTRPSFVDKVHSLYQERMKYLFSVAPRPLPPNPFMPDEQNQYVSQAAIESFAHRVRIAEDPMSIMDDMHNNAVTPEAAETFKTLYPRLYQEAQTALINNLPKVSKDLPYNTRFQLYVMFGVPTDISLTPEHTQAMQQHILEANGPVDGGKGQQGGPASASLQSIKTGTEPTVAQGLTSGASQ